MKTEVKKLDGTKREITVEVSGDVVKNKFDGVFQKISETAKIQGFRPGHAPRDLIEKNFSAEAHEMVLKDLIPDVYHEAVKSENLDVIEMPSISDVKLERSLLMFKATVEVSPEINLKDYKGIKLEYKGIDVSADDVKRNLDSMKESKKVDALDDSFAKGLGYPSLLELEKVVEKQIFLQKSNQQHQKIEHELIESLMKELKFKAPQSMCERQLADSVRQTKVDLAMRGVAREKIEEQEKEITERLKPEAEHQVRVYLVLAEVAKQEKIPLDDHMPNAVMELLLRSADWKVS